MTAEEMEVAYCKARITCMKSFVRWLREHIKTSDDAQAMGISDSDNLKLTIGAMKTTEAEISKELENIRLISEPEPLNEKDFKALEAAKLNDYLNSLKNPESARNIPVADLCGIK